MPLYFAYGSNMSSERLGSRLGKVVDFGWATLHGHRHRFEKLGADGSGKGNIVAHPTGVVHGVLYAISAAQLEILHGFEGGYHAVELEVVHRVAGARMHALTYQAIAPVGVMRPTPDYLAHYERGMREHGLPESYIRLVLDI